VMIGDLNDRGEGTRQIMDFLMRLEGDAAKKGGRVHTLIGNHEVLLLRGETRYLSQGDIRAFMEFLPPELKEAAQSRIARGLPLPRYEFGVGAVNAMRGDTAYAKWHRRKNSIVKIGDTLFVHAGVEKWALSADPAEINATIRQWVRHYQEAGPRPADATNWVMGHTGEYDWWKSSGVEGPLWTAAFSLDPRENKGLVIPLKQILAKLGVKRVVVGHITTRDGNVMMDHPTYGDGVVMTDTGISRGYPNPSWSSIEIHGGKVTAHYVDIPPELMPRPQYPLAIPVAQPVPKKEPSSLGQGIADCAQGLVDIVKRAFSGN
jgi:hypothetical protein